ncbi:MAG: hypothetical protein R3C19_03840 [Planctomycetaceae bacterium]
MNLKKELFAVLDALESATVKYAVCGGIAVAIHGFPRATRDLDVIIQEDDLARAETALQEIGFTVPAGIIPFGTGTQDVRKVFRISKPMGSEFLTLDLLLITPVLNDVWESRIELELDSRTVWVVSRDGLAKMKRMAGRLRDLADLEELGFDVDRNTN